MAQGDPQAGIKMVQEALGAMDANQYHIAALSTRRASAEGSRCRPHAEAVSRHRRCR